MAAELKLYGMWASPFSVMVGIALKLKGISYDYQEEDIQNKSETLLKLNPIHKKVPVLVHNGKTLVESQVILQYIDETWKEPPLLPADPYEKAKARFWIAFLNDKFIPRCRAIAMSQGEEQEKAVKETAENLKIFEEGVARDFATETPFYHGNEAGMLDIVMGANLCWFAFLTELTGIDPIDKETIPVIWKRLKAFEEVPAVKETLPPHEQQIGYAKALKEFLFGAK